MLVLGEDDVRRLLSWEQLFSALEKALIAFSAGNVQQPVRSLLAIAEHHGRWGLMPAVWDDFMGVKLVTVYEQNAGKGIPTHQATIQLFSARTGEPLAVLDGRLITEMRTAAVSAIAARLLTRDDVRSLAILGSGVQARSHLTALRMVRGFDDVRVWSRTAENAARFATEHGVRPTSLEEAIEGADLVVAVSSTETSIVRGEWLKPTACVIAVGTVGPKLRELDDAAMDAHIVVESRESAMRESGDIIDSGAEITAELGELLAETRSVPRDGKRVVYKSLGIAVEDLAAAMVVYRAASGSRG